MALQYQWAYWLLPGLSVTHACLQCLLQGPVPIQHTIGSGWWGRPASVATAVLVLRPVLLRLHVAIVALLLEVGVIMWAWHKPSWPGVHAGCDLHPECGH